jgi:superfamily II DNA helicase RecQ
MTCVANQFVQMIEGLKVSVTLIRLAALWRGTKNKKHIKGINLANLPCYGKGCCDSKDDADRIVRALLCDNIIQEVSEVNFSGYAANYVKLGPNAKALQGGNLHFYVAFPYGTVPSEDAIHCGKLN